MTRLAGTRVLVIEDEGPIAMMIEDMLADMGCVVAGSPASVDEAFDSVAAGGFDFALLDLNLRGASGAGVADALAKAGVPLAFVSGDGRAGVPAHLQDRPMLRKPFTSSELQRTLSQRLDTAA